jgi:hypothetical protein
MSALEELAARQEWQTAILGSLVVALMIASKNLNFRRFRVKLLQNLIPDFRGGSI